MPLEYLRRILTADVRERRQSIHDYNRERHSIPNVSRILDIRSATASGFCSITFIRSNLAFPQRKEYVYRTKCPAPGMRVTEAIRLPRDASTTSSWP